MIKYNFDLKCDKKYYRLVGRLGKNYKKKNKKTEIDMLLERLLLVKIMQVSQIENKLKND